MIGRFALALITAAVLLTGLTHFHPGDAAAPAGADEARTMLQVSPYRPQALVALASAEPDPARAARLQALAGQVSRRDPALQLLLMQRDLAAARYGPALDHASALMRQGQLRDEVGMALAQKAGQDRALVDAMANWLATPQFWADGFMLLQAARFDDGAIMAIHQARMRAGVKVQERFIGPLITQLLRRGRDQTALLLARDLAGSRLDTIPPWPPGGAQDASTPFGWHIPAGYRIEEGIGLRPELEPGARPAHALLGLPPGTYRIRASGADAATRAAWNWTMACGYSARRARRNLAREERFTVAASCPVQTLSWEADAFSGATAPPLPALSLEALP